MLRHPIIVWFVAALVAGPVLAKDINVNCELKVTPTNSHEVKADGIKLQAMTQTGECVLPDGTVAKKQFVNINAGRDMRGYSVYTLPSGDAIWTTFDAKAGDKGVVGTYQVTGGTGQFSKATGTGEFKSISPEAMAVSIQVKTAE